MSDNLSASHISRNLAAIAFFQKMHGLSPVTNHFLVRQTLKGYKRKFPSVDTRRPITINILDLFFNSLPHICSSSYETSLFRTAFVLTFFAALRISEVVSSNKKSESNLRLADILLSHNSLRVFIRKSKTDQSGRGIWLSLNSLDSHICPVRNISHYLAIRPFCLGSLFIHEDKSVLTRFQFNSLLKKCLHYNRLDAFKFTSHSFRIGAATEASRLGLESNLIKKLGRWESDRFQLYIRPQFVVSI